MSKILDQAIDAVRSLPPDEQVEIARAMRSLALEAQGFKPVPSGYEFRVPSPWMFGGDKHYLVSDAQIQEIGEARTSKSDMVLAILAASVMVVIALTLPVAWLPADFQVDHAVGRVLLWIVQGGAMLLANLQCCRWLTFRRLQPTLARLPLASE